MVYLLGGHQASIETLPNSGGWNSSKWKVNELFVFIEQQLKNLHNPI